MYLLKFINGVWQSNSSNNLQTCDIRNHKEYKEILTAMFTLLSILNTEYLEKDSFFIFSKPQLQRKLKGFVKQMHVIKLFTLKRAWSVINKSAGPIRRLETGSNSGSEVL